jgi:hypothetical protein
MEPQGHNTWRVYDLGVMEAYENCHFPNSVLYVHLVLTGTFYEYICKLSHWTFGWISGKAKLMYRQWLHAVAWVERTRKEAIRSSIVHVASKADKRVKMMCTGWDKETNKSSDYEGQSLKLIQGF